MRFCVEFCLQVRLLAAAHAGAGWIAALRHEAIDHAVEHHAIVKTFACQLGNPLDMPGRQVRAQLDNNIAGIEGESEGVGHL